MEEIKLLLNDKKILIAEDDDINYMYLSHMLDKAGATVVRAINGHQVVDLTTEHIYDMILMDLKMPVMDGFEATKIIRSRYPDIPIIALTAFALEEDRKRAVQAGCSDFIKKPVFPDSFMQIVTKHL